MKNRGARAGAMLILLVVAGGVEATRGKAASESLATQASASRVVEVFGVAANDRVVYGQIRNLTEAELRDVRLLAVHEFRWRNEQNPGSDNPGRSESFVIDRVAPHATMTFSHDIVPPLPVRSDGWFVTRVDVMSFTEVGP